MTLSNYNALDDTRKIGINKPILAAEGIKGSSGTKYYAEFEIKRLTKATSFMAGMETMYISKKDYKGKATKIYHVYRITDKRLIVSSALEKDRIIEMVQKKYMEYDDE